MTGHPAPGLQDLDQGQEQSCLLARMAAMEAQLCVVP